MWCSQNSKPVDESPGAALGGLLTFMLCGSVALVPSAVAVVLLFPSSQGDPNPGTFLVCWHFVWHCQHWTELQPFCMVCIKMKSCGGSVFPCQIHLLAVPWVIRKSLAAVLWIFISAFLRNIFCASPVWKSLLMEPSFFFCFSVFFFNLFFYFDLPKFLIWIRPSATDGKCKIDFLAFWIYWCCFTLED